MLYGASRVASRSPLFLATLVALFFISFSLPLVLTFKFGGSFGSSTAPGDSDTFFPGYTAIQVPGQHLEVSHSDDLNPMRGSDFIVSAWFKLSRLPQVKEKILLLGKNDANDDPHAGFVLGLSRDSDTIRPIVYWGDSTHRKWYSFSDISIAAQSWFMLALSFQDDKYLGLHIAMPGESKTEVKLLGGYEVEDGVVPDSPGAFMIGSWGEGRFRGRIGPFGIFSKPGIGEGLKDVLKSLARRPLEVPDTLSAKHVKLWVPDGLEDRSGLKRSLQMIGARKRS